MILDEVRWKVQKVSTVLYVACSVGVARSVGVAQGAGTASVGLDNGNGFPSLNNALFSPVGNSLWLKQPEMVVLLTALLLSAEPSEPSEPSPMQPPGSAALREGHAGLGLPNALPPDECPPGIGMVWSYTV